MKKFYAVIAAVLVLSMGSTVFAAKSPNESTGSTVVAEAAVDKINMEKIEAFGADDTKIDIKVSPTKSVNLIGSLDKDAQAAVETAISDGLIDIKLGDKQVPAVDVLGLVEVEDPGVKGSVTLSIPIAGIKAGDTVLVMHYTGGKWETIVPDRVMDGIVIVTLSSFSPIAVVRVEASDASTPSDDGTNNTEDNPAGNNNNNNNNIDNRIDNSNNINNDTTYGDTINENNQNTTINNINQTGGGTTPSASAGSRGTSTGAAPTSPKTGQSVPGLFILALFCAAGILACGLRMKKNKVYPKGHTIFNVLRTRK